MALSAFLDLRMMFCRHVPAALSRPRGVGAVQRPTATRSSTPSSQPSAGANATVMVVDDEPGVRAALERALRIERYDVRLAGDGTEALALLAERSPDAIVLDVSMPDVDGLEVCRRLRAAGDRTPVLMLTARDAVDDRVAGLDAGADDYLVKPFALKELQARLRALLRRTEADARGRAALRRPRARPGRARGPPRRPRDRALAHRVQPARAVPRAPAPGPHPLADLRARVGLRLRLDSNALGVYIGYLRRKTEAGGEPRLLHTVRGVGYVLRDRVTLGAPPDPAVGARRRGDRRARVARRLSRDARDAAGPDRRLAARAGPRRRRSAPACGPDDPPPLPGEPPPERRPRVGLRRSSCARTARPSACAATTSTSRSRTATWPPRPRQRHRRRAVATATGRRAPARHHGAAAGHRARSCSPAR